ncbi:outer membrane beta-barrel protein [Aquimarina gracilis]|uniref:Outer membrane beta-barrel protein n=1 Tax=Aquimarina gracilis TaxID=874422 RepID=A0ABU6A1P6_9FLAO|nr:outer membrane beta-barrel protein [Aquimarina gracilis]MEB3348088.1 outer membrane beta-barrel protein [Aquimarina gracilis]
MKLRLFLLLAFFSILVTSAQNSIELTTGITVSKLNFEENFLFSEAESGSSVFVNLGYQYEIDKKGKMALVFSAEFLKRNSSLVIQNSQPITGSTSIRFMQLGFSPKFRYFLSQKENDYRVFLGAGPSFRYNFDATQNGLEIEEESFERLVIGGIYNIGLNYYLSNRTAIILETGVMNDFQNNFKEFFAINDKSKFFDFYARIGVSYQL